MNIELAYGILEMLQTMKEAVMEMKNSYRKGDLETFHTLSVDLQDALTAIQDVAKREVEESSKIRLYDACTCGLESLKDIKGFIVTAPQKIDWKLEYEFSAIIETAAMQFYYWGIVNDYPEARMDFLEFIANTDTFALLKVPKEERKFLYDLTIIVTGYNKLEYTKKCVESIQKNLPKDIKCELILFNHGSKDGTKEYFESIDGAKVINVAVNGAVPAVSNKSMCEGKYSLNVSNDIIIGENAIGNLYRSVAEHADYGYVVPSTSAICNLQTIPVNYQTWEQFETFVRKNNIYDVKRHEQRVRLCNPLHIMPTDICMQMVLDMYEDKCCNKQKMSFPDDKNSLWMRRNGYKCILAKDSYCHHFGSVTLNDEMGTQQKKQEFYLEGRKNFFTRYGVDPWGIGLCYDLELFNGWQFPITNNVTILGINCGLGSNSLKVKEILKENGATGVTLYNATQEGRYLYDLQGVSDEVFLFWNLSDMIDKIGIKKYNYVVIEDAIQGDATQDSLQKVLYAGLQFDELAWKMPNGDWQIVKWSDIS